MTDTQPAAEKFMNRREASQYLKDKHNLSYATGTLAKFATVGGGPTFKHFGRFPVYTETDLDNWVTSRLR